jgi:hypothetical protein
METLKSMHPIGRIAVLTLYYLWYQNFRLGGTDNTKVTINEPFFGPREFLGLKEFYLLA